MRILTVVDSWDDRTLSVVIGNRSLGEALVALGHEGDYLFRDAVRLWVPSLKLSPLTFAAGILPEIRRRHAQQPYDIVVISGGDGCLYGPLRRWRHPEPRPLFVQISHGLEHRLWAEMRQEECLGHDRLSPQHKAYWGLVLLNRVRLAIATCDHMICRTEDDRQWVIARGWRHPEQVTHIPNGVEEKFFVHEGEEARTEDLLFVGFWQARKGKAYLVEAYTKLRERLPHLRLTIIGTWWLGPEAVLRDFPPEIRNGVRVVPYMPGDDLVHEYARHRLFVFPTLFEATPSVMLEAMASGLPVITTRAYGMKEVIEDGVHGLLVPPRDSDALVAAVLRLWEDAALRQRLREAAWERARDYTWRRIAQRTEALFLHLLRGRKETRVAQPEEARR